MWFKLEATDLTLKRRDAVLAAILIICVSQVSIVSGYKSNWWESKSTPLVLVGRLVEVHNDVAYTEMEDIGRDNVCKRYYRDIGMVHVDSLLYGEISGDLVPVIWQSRARLIPEQPGCSLSSFSEQSPPFGKKSIWVLYQPGTNVVGFKDHRSFEQYPMSLLDWVGCILEKLQRDEKAKIETECRELLMP
jgi:hypothetical protein